MDIIIIFAARVLIVLPILLICYLFFKLNASKRKELAMVLVGGGILSLVLAKIGSQLLYNPRPFIGDHVKSLFIASHVNGFPSEHTLLSSFLGFAALRYSRKLGVFMLIVAALIGWARVAAGVHHFVDVAGAFFITGVATLVIVKILEIKNKKPKNLNQ